MPLRVGLGYDIHRRAQGRLLVLGGVRFQTDWGLEGHSDADVLAHAIGDALLGSVALGDLGEHFPPGDPRWKDASSLHLLRLIRSMLDGVGAAIVHVDATVVAEEPKIAPVRDAIRLNLAQALRVGDQQVSVKATTNETIGAVGRREGIAALALATVEVP
jgi:2-C-methyl-D-erythritol 2,4-cyclodiphosphate synthase